MKYIYIMMAYAAIITACGTVSKKEAEKIGGEHVHGIDCELKHDHSKHIHDHAGEGECCDHEHSLHGEESHLHDCTQDHDHGDHIDVGHTHSNECDHKGHDHTPHSHGSTAENIDEIIFPRSQAEKTDFEIQEVRRGIFNEVIKTGGTILPAQGDEVSVVASAPGIVKFAGPSLVDGSRVGKGDGLFYISSKNIASGDILSITNAAYLKARSDFERAEKLLADQIVSQREYDEAELAYRQAETEYNALAGSGTGNGVKISAPITGYVTALEVNEGDYVETGQMLASVSQNRTLSLRAEVSQKYFNRLKNITGANFTVPYDNITYSVEDLGGRLVSVSRNAISGSTLIPVTFQFNNVSTVLPGSYVEVNLLGQTESDVISLPLTAITEQQGLYYVYVQLDEDGYERREVKIGADDGVRIKILSGLTEGEKVVTRGAMNVKMASASASIPHSHEH